MKPLRPPLQYVNLHLYYRVILLQLYNLELSYLSAILITAFERIFQTNKGILGIFYFLYLPTIPRVKGCYLIKPFTEHV